MKLSSGQLGLALLIITMLVVLAGSLFLLSGLLPSSTAYPSGQTTTTSFPTAPPPHSNTTTSGETSSMVSGTISTSYVTLTSTTSLTASSIFTTTKTILENQTSGSTATITKATTITTTHTTTVSQKIYSTKTTLTCNPDLLRLGQKGICRSITTSPVALTGQVTFSSVGSVAGVFSRPSCQTGSYPTDLLKCSVVFTPTQLKGRQGVLVIWASYSGSAKNSPSRGNDVLLVLRLPDSFSLANVPSPILGEGSARLPQLSMVLGVFLPIGYLSVPRERRVRIPPSSLFVAEQVASKSSKSVDLPD
jgi:hypothetical protein